VIKEKKMFNKVLAATDMVTVLDATVLTAVRIAEQNNAKLHILHVLESASTDKRNLIRHFKTGEEIITGAEYEETVKEEINKIYADVLKPYSNYEFRVATGFPREDS
jgi:nucleotide-binding universal stress UspA family protein